MSYKWEKHLNIEALNGKKILVAGGTGFIGSRLIEFFIKYKVEVYVLTRKKLPNTEYVKYIQADLFNIDLLTLYAQNNSFDLLIYLAANIPLSGTKKENYLEALKSTLEPFVNFCTVFIHKDCKLIYASSIDVLGACEINEYSEEILPNGATPYGIAKYCGEFYAQNICKKQEADCLIYRFSQVYGPREPIVRIIPIIKNALINKSEFNVWTDGIEKRRFLYIDDAVQSIFLGLITDIEGIYNIAGSEVISIIELIKLMEDIFDKKLIYKILHKTKGVDNIPSIEKAEKILKFKPEVSMYDGMMIIKESELA